RTMPSCLRSASDSQSRSSLSRCACHQSSHPQHTLPDRCQRSHSQSQSQSQLRSQFQSRGSRALGVSCSMESCFSPSRHSHPRFFLSLACLLLVVASWGPHRLT
ncbi:unnamed protein product, partial [Closterium sp. Naga37s-1]